MNFQDKNILITGITGFVGSHLAKRLIDKECNVYGLIRRRTDGSIQRNIKYMNIADDIKTLNGDLLDITSIENAIEESQPDFIFHLAAQSFIPDSFSNPIETQKTNTEGTSNILEAMRVKDSDARMIFAGSSDEYGLVTQSQSQYEDVIKNYSSKFADLSDSVDCEIPITEKNSLRPVSPYGVSKVHGDYLTRSYYQCYGLDTVVSRAFNTEGAGRGNMFVTSVITNQVMQLKLGKTSAIRIGNINIFRDWTHIDEVINGYLRLASKAKTSEVYNQGSMRTNSILSYILLSIQEARYDVESVETVYNTKKIDNPTEINYDKIYGIEFAKTKVDSMMLDNELEYGIEDKALIVKTDKNDIKIEFDISLFRQNDIPILLSDTSKIQKLKVKIDKSINDIIKDQLNFYTRKENQ